MPEYSSTTITPADGVQVPSMNGSTSGNFVLSALKAYILAAAGQANGLATLGADGKLTASQIPDSVKDIIVVASSALLPPTGTAGKLYITADDNKGFRWDPDLTTPDYVLLFDPSVSADLAQLVSDLLDGTVTVKNAEKAQKDASGNVITTTYATKTELSAEETARQNAVAQEQSAREAADSDLQSQIVNTNAELDNVEALIGGETETENTDPSSGSLLAQSRLIHHANMLPNGELGRLGARAVKWKQLMNKANYPATATYDNLTVTNNGDGSLTFYAPNALTTTVTVAVEGITPAKGAVSGHTYFFKGGAANIKFGTGNGGAATENGEGKVSVVTFSSSISMGYQIAQGTVISSPVTLFPMLCDLTDMGMASLTADQFRALFPASYYPNDTGHIYDLNPSGFRIRGINLWDEEWELGTINSDGTLAPDSTMIRTKNYVPVTGNSVYYFKIPNNAGIFWYDADKRFISTTGGYNTSKTAPANACYMKFYVAPSYGTTYNNDIQICLDSLPTAVKQTYHPYEGQTVLTPQIADGHYVNESVYDYVENVVEDGIVKGKFHSVAESVNLWQLNWDYNVGSDFFYAALTNAPKTDENGLFNFLTNIPAQKQSVSNNYGLQYYAGYLRYKNTTYSNDLDGFIGYLENISGVLNYEKATETITDCEPLRSFGISDYSTIEPITPQTELVNRIDVPFSVKTVSANTIISMINANRADIDDHTQILSNHNKRLRNLEHKAGDYETVTYPDNDYGMDEIPPGVEEYAPVLGLIMNTRMHNNHASRTSSDWASVNVTLSISLGVYTITPTNAGSVYKQVKIGLQNGHTYIASAKAKTSNSSNLAYLVFRKSGDIAYSSVSTDSTTGATLTELCTVTDSGSTFCMMIQPTAGLSDYATFEDVILVDLTQYFSTSDLSFLGATDSAKLATIQRDYPELLIPSDYDIGTRVDTTYSAVKSKGFNLWNEVWEPGVYNAVTGEKYPNDQRIRSASYIDVTPNTSYYAKVPSPFEINIFFYDENKNFLYNVGKKNTTFDTPPNCRYITFYVGGGDITSYGNNICINISGTEDGTYKSYRDPVTLTLPSPVTGKSAGSVHQIYYPETGEMTEPLSQEYRLDGLGLDMDLGTSYFSVILPVSPKATNDTVANAICMGYIPDTYSNVSGSPQATVDRHFAISAVGRILIVDRRYQTLQGFLDAVTEADASLIYELATPDPNSQATEPMPDPFIKVEGGGTIRPHQTQETKIDGSMSVGYMYA